MASSFQYTLFILLSPLVIILSSGVILYARFYRPSPETRTLSWLMFTACGWLLLNSLELAAGSESTTIFWAQLSYAFITTTPVAWLAFAFRYSGLRKWLTFPRLSLFFAVPVTTFLLVQTNEVHHLIWQSYRFFQTGNLLAMSVSHGSWFWIHAFYSYALIFLGAFLISKKSFRSFALYRRQSIWLIVGALTPILFNIIYVFDLIPGLEKDYTSMSFAVAAIGFTIGMARYDLFDLRPIAREAMIDGMKDAMMAIDTQGRIVDLNPAAESIIGAPANSLIGQPAREVLSPWQDLVQRFQDEVDIQSEIGMERQGTIYTYDLRVSPLLDRRGQLLGRLIMLHDITERKKVEEALWQRTAELEARNEELDAFAHTVAHNLKNPLTALTGYSNLLMRRLDEAAKTEDVNYFLNAIYQNGKKMARIIEELLLLASVRKLEQVDVEPLDMGRIVAEVMDRLRNQIEETEAEIIIPDQWPQGMGYGPWVEEVWANYLSNALKYGGNPPRVELGANEIGDGFSTIRFWVRDNGPGISPNKQPHLFTLFTRLDEVHAEGTGLGLSITHRIVRRLGGEVGVESQEGEGCIFWFTLPSTTEPS